jgi:phenylalanyl-tRNA synthetase beta chain
MRVSLKWLRDYTDITIPAADLAARMTLGGVEVGKIERFPETWDPDKIFVGQITALAPHPNADRLQLATTDYGKGTITVVTGAWNIAVGDKVPVALLGARLRNGHSEQHEMVELKPTKLRGVPSEGMVCSALELGLGEDHAGIMILPADAPVGMPFVDYLGDTVFELEIKGRWDCLSLLGVAQEAAGIQRAHLNQPVAYREPPVDYLENGEEIARSISIEIADPDLCPRYSATLLRGVTVGPSPRWLQERLLAVGLRPINNIVDITNYVMWETGQPLHAFDYDLIHGKKIIVRRARAGETIVSLDGKQRDLTTDMCMIADVDRAVAIGGVMGGLDSEVSDKTTNILLESANFLPTSIRRTGRALQMFSEAQRRFEKGLPADGTIPAARRATRLMLEIAGGVAAKGVADCYPAPTPRQPITLTTHEVTRVLGVEIALAEMARVLTALGFAVTQQAEDTLRVVVPLRRVDCTIPADLIEEIARIVGYDTMPTTMIAAPIPEEQLTSLEREWEEIVRDCLVGCGYSEVILYALSNEQTAGKMQPKSDPIASTVPDLVARRLLGEGAQPLRLANPMRSDMDLMRTSALPDMLATLSANLHRQDRDVAVFEIGRVYLERGDELPDERRVLTLASGQFRSAAAWGQREESDLFDAKGAAEAVLAAMRLCAPAYRIALTPARHPSFHPGRLALVSLERSTGKKGKYDPAVPVGLLGEMHSNVCANFDIAERVYVLCLDLTQAFEMAGRPGAPSRDYRPVPRFPPTMQDISLTVKDDVPAARIEDVIRRAGGGLVVGVQLFDLYKGERVPAGMKSLAYSITYQSLERTLESKDVAEAHARIEKRLEQEVGAAIRR